MKDHIYNASKQPESTNSLNVVLRWQCPNCESRQ
eukprot:COSAG02_NODE_31820_length_526_cov_12.039813_2_plen_33_part_01